MEQDSVALQQDKQRLETEAAELAERLDAVMRDKFAGRSSGFDADTPIDKTLNFLSSFIAVRFICSNMHVAMLRLACVHTIQTPTIGQNVAQVRRKSLSSDQHYLHYTKLWPAAQSPDFSSTHEAAECKHKGKCILHYSRALYRVSLHSAAQSSTEQPNLADSTAGGKFQGFAYIAGEAASGPASNGPVQHPE